MPINALTAGVAALAINSTAFTIEIFRGGFAAVPVAQHDAVRALGLRPALIMALVVVPQVGRIVLPALALVLLTIPILQRTRQHPWLQAALRGVNPAVIAVIAVALLKSRCSRWCRWRC